VPGKINREINLDKLKDKYLQLCLTLAMYMYATAYNVTAAKQITFSPVSVR